MHEISVAPNAIARHRARAESMADPTPEELLAAISNGCADSFSALYDAFHQTLYGIAVGITRNHAEAQEVLQEAFLEIWKKSDKYDPRLGKASTWVIHLTRNLCIDRLRKRQRRDAGDQKLQDQPQTAAAEVDPAHELISQETIERVRSVLQTLSDDQRQALELAFYQGLSQSQIAEKLGEPLGTIKSRIRRAMERVRSVATEFRPDSS